jgi:hypothetical protein
MLRTAYIILPLLIRVLDNFLRLRSSELPGRHCGLSRVEVGSMKIGQSATGDSVVQIGYCV